MYLENIKPNKKIYEFEGLRGCLSLWVLLFHVLAITGYIDNKYLRQVNNLIDGVNAVDIFIILSGFMIAMLIQNMQEPYYVYIFRRFVRLYPIYILCVIFALTLSFFKIIPKRYPSEDTLKHIILHVTMLHGIIPANILKGASGAILNPAWSISLEWQFYLIAPFIFLVLKKNKIAGASILLLISLLLYRMISNYGSWDGAFLVVKLPLFWVGIISFFIYKWVMENIEKLKDTAPYLTPVLLFFYFSLFSFKSHFGVFLWLVIFSLLLTHSLNRRLVIPSFLLWPLQSRLLQWLGKISYSVYLIHEILIWVIIHFLSQLPLHLDPFNRLLFVCVFSLLFTLILANISYNLVESPAVNWGKKLINSSYFEYRKNGNN